MIFASTPATGSARHKGPGRYLAAGSGWGRVHEPNPVLLEFREEAEQLGRAYPADWLRVCERRFWGSEVTREHLEHARLVLGRLVIHQPTEQES